MFHPHPTIAFLLSRWRTSTVSKGGLSGDRRRRRSARGAGLESRGAITKDNVPCPSFLRWNLLGYNARGDLGFHGCWSADVDASNAVPWVDAFAFIPNS